MNDDDKLMAAIAETERLIAEKRNIYNTNYQPRKKLITPKNQPTKAKPKCKPKLVLKCKFCGGIILTHAPFQKWCAAACGASYRQLEQHIKAQFYDDENCKEAELAKLEQLGINYKLPPREVKV